MIDTQGSPVIYIYNLIPTYILKCVIPFEVILYTQVDKEQKAFKVVNVANKENSKSKNI